jgi:hypothetical protein
MPELSVTDCEVKKTMIPPVVATGTGASRNSRRRLRFASESPHRLSVPFNFGLQFPSLPLTRNDRSENDLDSFAEGVASVEHSWVDDRELSHRYAQKNLSKNVNRKEMLSAVILRVRLECEKCYIMLSESKPVSFSAC